MTSLEQSESARSTPSVGRKKFDRDVYDALYGDRPTKNEASKRLDTSLYPEYSNQDRPYANEYGEDTQEMKSIWTSIAVSETGDGKRCKAGQMRKKWRQMYERSHLDMTKEEIRLFRYLHSPNKKKREKLSRELNGNFSGKSVTDQRSSNIKSFWDSLQGEISGEKVDIKKIRQRWYDMTCDDSQQCKTTGTTTLSEEQSESKQHLQLDTSTRPTTEDTIDGGNHSSVSTPTSSNPFTQSESSASA